MNLNSLTEHAQSRLQQRGVPIAVLSLVLDEFDRCVPVGGQCESLSISRRQANTLVGSYPRQLVDAATRLAVILNERGRVVTVMKQHRNKRAKAYRAGR